MVSTEANKFRVRAVTLSRNLSWRFVWILFTDFNVATVLMPCCSGFNMGKNCWFGAHWEASIHQTLCLLSIYCPCYAHCSMKLFYNLQNIWQPNISCNEVVCHCLLSIFAEVLMLNWLWMPLKFVPQSSDPVFFLVIADMGSRRWTEAPMIFQHRQRLSNYNKVLSSTCCFLDTDESKMWHNTMYCILWCFNTIKDFQTFPNIMFYKGHG